MSAAEEERLKSTVNSSSDYVTCDELYEDHECSEWSVSMWDTDLIQSYDWVSAEAVFTASIAYIQQSYISTEDSSFSICSSVCSSVSCCWIQSVYICSVQALQVLLLVLLHHLLSLPLKYRMCRAVRTVKDFVMWVNYRSCRQFICRHADSKWDSQWQADCQSEIQWYLLRLEIIKKIRYIAQTQRTSEKAAMWQINQLQERMNCSLDQLCKQLWAGRKIAV
jgi:hypothetical protein